MSDSQAPAPSRGGLSLYANLLSSDGASASNATISRAPVPFTQDDSQNEASKKQNLNAAQLAALRFQPTRRPQLTPKAKPKSAALKAAAPSQPAVVVQAAAPASEPRAPVKSTLEDWTALDDEDGFYQGPKRERGGRKKRKKNREEERRPETDWSEIYDPSRPTNYADYKGSEEEVRCEQEWKARLYAHRRAREATKDSDSDDEGYGSTNVTRNFAPPSNFSFAPPPIEPPATDIETSTGDDAYARRLALSNQIPPPPPPPEAAPVPAPALPAPSAPTQAGVISRAPVRFADLPSASADIPATEEELSDVLAAEEEEEKDTSAAPASDAPRSLKPGQKGFAERLMSKYGWTKGTGLGKDESGIINPLHVQVLKRKKKPDSESGGFADPKGLGKIVGGQKKKGTETASSKFGEMSEVVVLRGMVDGMDLDAEVGDGELMQEIGDECAEKYGRVERVYIDRGDGVAPKVFVKFTSQLSGLRAVNALEGRIFNGNTISALYYDAEKFEKGIYE